MRIQCAVGVDPGSASGGICKYFHDDNGLRALVYLKLQTATQRDILDFLTTVPDDTRCCGVLERVSAMPGQGVSSTFKFGASFGELRMALLAAEIPFTLVTPSKWQGAMGCRSKGDKNVTKRKAQELFPGEKMTHWKADATLIAEYARRIWE